MELLSLWLPPFLLSLIPGLFWLWFVHSQRPNGTESKGTWFRILVAFVGGCFSVFLVLAISAPIHQYFPPLAALHSSSWGRFLYFVLVVGLVEEFSKLVAVRFLVYPFSSFRDGWDGLMASSASALGFATAENAKYIVETGTSTVLIGRSVSATIGHVLMSGLWGYALGQAKQPTSQRSGRALLVLPALFLSAIGHGAYDFLLIQDLGFLALGVLLALWWIFWSNISESRLLTSRRSLRTSRVKECPNCSSLGLASYRFCPQCRQEFAETASISCQNCLTRISDASQCECTHCHSLLAD